MAGPGIVAGCSPEIVEHFYKHVYRSKTYSSQPLYATGLLAALDELSLAESDSVCVV